MPTNKKPAPGRRNVPLFVVLPPDERARVVTFAGKIGRPLSWTVRDALRAYLNAVEPDIAQVEKMRAPSLDPAAAGKTVQAPNGRPRNRGYGNLAGMKLPPDMNPAELQAVLDELEKDLPKAARSKGTEKPNPNDR